MSITHPSVLLRRLFQPQTYDFNDEWAQPEGHEPYWMLPSMEAIEAGFWLTNVYCQDMW
jgi:hypothetical protein